MKNTLVITLGNRDLQFAPTLPTEYLHHTKPNNETNTLTINNTNAKDTFLSISQLLLANIEKLADYMLFPMINSTLQYLHTAYPGKKWALLFITSNQQPNDRQDCVYIAQIRQHLFGKKGYEVAINNFACPPTDFANLTLFFAHVFDALLNQHPTGSIAVSNSGGTPDMRAASYAAGFFKGLEYITIEARTQQVNQQNFKALEKKVLEVTLKKMIATYDYQGILNLPLTESIKTIATKALQYYNLNIGTGFIQKKNKPAQPYNTKALFAIQLLINNMWVCYKQARYAEALQRLFRIEEATWYLLYYLFLEKEGFISKHNPNKISYQNNGETKEVPFEKITNFGFNYNKELLQNHFEHLLTYNDNSDAVLKIPNGTVPLSGKNIYYFFFVQANFAQPFTNFFANINRDTAGNAYTRESPLNTLRNKSFLGHGLNGVEKEQLDNLLPENKYETFDQQLRKLFENYFQLPFNNDFDSFNNAILQAFVPN